ncbi:YitT family protein [Alkalihalophilus lindianensis]|uniref:YitT family protein n=1 Tax=Alkalihalophilus lindianensis TaxID=1630542 RepID=A0ABU3X8A7_9BACI|nr:YitT family protein [Alkalihalophilus lindianensis]MDV2683523.1 YitT family protein [Alkalihalophilus lindianensis]
MLERFRVMGLVLVGLILTSLGLRFLAMHDLTFGGTAGLATVLTYMSPWSWGVLFFLVNLPFFLISWTKLGKWFTLSSLLSITAISVIRDLLDVMPFFNVPLWLATALAGICIGIGVTLVLNNGSSLGGIHILALYIDQKWGINRGLTIFISDFLIIVFATLLVGWSQALLSVFVIFVASTIIGRYKKSPIPKDAENTDGEFSSLQTNSIQD